MGNAKLKEDASGESYLDELAPGSKLLQGQFTIEKFLNSGGFGITYLAKDSLDRRVVIKECFPSSFCNRSRAIVQARSRAHQQELRSVVQLFVQEARSLAKLDHPNIVGVHQVFEDNETAYMVLDFVEGRDLLDMIEDNNHGLSAPQIKGILKDVLSAVQFIHEQDILHRDISPDNILLDADLRPVLIDFGAAREEATKKSRVLSALRVVKDGYSPQEFYIQGSEQAPSSDLYALGATFYHLIEGSIPPNSQARLAAIASGDSDPYQPLVGRVNGFDAKFLGAIDTALGILPKDRVQSAAEWLSMMEGGRRKSRAVTQQAPISSAVAETRAEAKRSKLGPLLGSVAALALIAVGALTATGALDLKFLQGEGAATVVTTTPEEAASATTIEEAPVVAEINAEQPETIAAAAPADDLLPEALVADTSDAPGPELDLAAALDLAALSPSTPTDAPADIAATPAPLSDPEQSSEITNVAAAEIAVVDAPAPVVDDIAIALDITPELTASLDTAAPEITAPQVVAALEAPQVVDVAAPKDDAPFVASPDGADIPPAPVAAIDPYALPYSMAVRVDLPFSGDPGSNEITQAAIVAPLWVRPGARILAVNGIEVDSIDQIETTLANAEDANTSGTLDLVFTVKDQDGSVGIDHSWPVNVSHITTLSDGTSFETRMVEDNWKTFVTAVPASNAEMQIGDEVIAYVPTSETLNDLASIREILLREINAGTENLNFAVSREGSMWLVSHAFAKGA